MWVHMPSMIGIPDPPRQQHHPSHGNWILWLFSFPLYHTIANYLKSGTRQALQVSAQPIQDLCSSCQASRSSCISTCDQTTQVSSINKLTFCAVGHAHDRSAEDQEPQGPSLQAHSRVHNSCPRVIELLPPSDHHDQNIFCFSRRCSTTTSTPVQKASTPSLSSRSAVSSANQVGRLATRVCAEKREQTSTSQPARKAKDGAYWVCSCTTKLMIASPTRP